MHQHDNMPSSMTPLYICTSVKVALDILCYCCISIVATNIIATKAVSCFGQEGCCSVETFMSLHNYVFTLIYLHICIPLYTYTFTYTLLVCADRCGRCWSAQRHGASCFQTKEGLPFAS